MPTCFVIQPFDSGKFDKRFEDIYKPALEEAGLEPYRVDRDRGVEVPIDAIEERIRQATICLADITTNNPNVWYELGYALAAGRSVIMVCSDERNDRLPFDIQHRTVIRYDRESLRDFDQLREEVSKRATSLIQKNELRQIIEADQLAPQEGLSAIEISVLAIAAAETEVPGSSTSVVDLKRNAERSGLTRVGFGLGFRRLTRKGLVELGKVQDEDGVLYDTVALTEQGWMWIDQNEALFSLRKDASDTFASDDIPF